jgi:hypothetical protein
MCSRQQQTPNFFGLRLLLSEADRSASVLASSRLHTALYHINLLPRY